MKAMDPEKRRLIEANLFPHARPAVEPWDEFPWHPNGTNRCATDRPHSSQALAIDVFGTLMTASQKDRDAILDRLVERLGLPAGGPWYVKLEWKDAANRMKEWRKSQIDTVARSPKCLIFFECKFKEEDGGPCSQTRALSSGANKGIVQCNGRHEIQHNPVKKSMARCSLTGKGIRYWEVIPELFLYRNDADYNPCPFAGPWFQWMRNLTCCWLTARQEQLTPAFVLSYADGPGLPMAEKIAGKRSAEWTAFTSRLRPGAMCFKPISFQQLVAGAEQAVADVAGDVWVWQDLGQWVQRKISDVCGTARPTMQRGRGGNTPPLP
jgi:hypothetical protein